MASLSEISDFISDISGQGAAWYRGISGTPVVVPATTGAAAAANQLAIQQQAQAQLTSTNPVLAGILANPTVVIAFVVIAGLLIYSMSQRK
jgi:hypothetical protein